MCPVLQGFLPIFPSLKYNVHSIVVLWSMFSAFPMFRYLLTLYDCLCWFMLSFCFKVENIPQEPVSVTRSVKASKPILRTAFSKQANTTAEVKPSSKPSRQATPTPTSQTTLPSTRQTNSARSSNLDSRTSSIKSNPRASALPRSSSVGKSVSSAKSATLTTPEIRARPVSTSRSRVYSSGERSTGRSKISDDVNPVLMGTQMVERVVNMRKLPPPKHDDNTSLGFGRTLSKSSLDMALRHMVHIFILFNHSSYLVCWNM